MENYDDIINLPHHVSKKHPRLSMEQRAAQFAPFAALTGYEDNIKEIIKITEGKMEHRRRIMSISFKSKLNIIKNGLKLIKYFFKPFFYIY